MRSWLRDIRISHGLTMKEIGTILGISESYYCCIENGIRQKNMDVKLLSGISAALGISVQDIIELEAKWKQSLDLPKMTE